MKTQPGEAAISSKIWGHVSGRWDCDIAEILSKKDREGQARHHACPFFCVLVDLDGCIKW
jgi:hypothetical protein